MTPGKQYMVTTSTYRWEAGEVGIALKNDFPEKYQVKLALGPGRIFYFYDWEVVEVEEPKCSWCQDTKIIYEGRPQGESCPMCE